MFFIKKNCKTNLNILQVLSMNVVLRALFAKLKYFHIIALMGNFKLNIVNLTFPIVRAMSKY